MADSMDKIMARKKYDKIRNMIGDHQKSYPLLDGDFRGRGKKYVPFASFCKRSHPLIVPSLKNVLLAPQMAIKIIKIPSRRESIFRVRPVSDGYKSHKDTEEEGKNGGYRSMTIYMAPTISAVALCGE